MTSRPGRDQRLRSQAMFRQDHIVYALVLIALAATASGATWGLARWWNGLPVVKANPWLR